MLVVAGLGRSDELKLIPIGAGETATLPRGPIHRYQFAFWSPDGKRVVIAGPDAEGQRMLFVQDVEGGLPRPLTNVFILRPSTADGRFIPVKLRQGEPWVLFPVDGGEPRTLPFVKTEEWPIVFSKDDKSLFVADRWMRMSFPIRVVRLDLATGRREPWLELGPPDRAGIGGMEGMTLTRDGRFYAYAYERNLSDLYLVEGLR